METLAPLRCCAYNSIKSLTLAMEILSQRTLPTPLELIAEQSGADRWFLPTGSLIVQPGDPVRAIFAVERGLVSLDGPTIASSFRCRSGDLFSYPDLASRHQRHQLAARALTPVQLLRLDRASFLELIHRHPTLVIELLQQQYGRVRAQRRQSAIAPAPFSFHGSAQEHHAA